jgi:hypothetical protein
MAEQQPDPQRLRSIKLDLEKRYLQIESTDATIVRLSLTPQGIAWELLQPPTITTARAVERAVQDADAETDPPATPEGAEGKEKTPVYTFTGRIKGQVKEGRPDPQGKKTAWATFAAHEEGNDQARVFLADFRRHTANIALSLPANAQITISGYIRESEDPSRRDTLYVFNMPHHPGRPQKQE